MMKLYIYDAEQVSRKDIGCYFFFHIFTRIDNSIRGAHFKKQNFLES